ncbi:unnamed protein product [Gongylonema pulchrum]|uniref:Uncharacterized protein n=1 Tax=Gongylonema pulchrum TaxID=637853 RepID=A0A183DPS1_9BILA|nr:unnamed protein product [Gongylonema pulchrum]
MLRVLGSGSVRQALRAARVAASNVGVERSYFWGPRYPLSTVFRSIDRQLQELERQFDRVFCMACFITQFFTDIVLARHATIAPREPPDFPSTSFACRFFQSDSDADQIHTLYAVTRLSTEECHAKINSFGVRFRRTQPGWVIATGNLDKLIGQRTDCRYEDAVFTQLFSGFCH